MNARAQLSVTDQRRVSRHPVDCHAVAEDMSGAEYKLHIVNISTQGFMVDNGADFSRGERFIVQLDGIGRIEAYVIWVHDERAGFHFERIIRIDDFKVMITKLQPNARLRRIK